MSRPKVICTCRLSFSPGSPLSGGVAMGLLGPPSMKNLRKGGSMSRICEKGAF